MLYAISVVYLQDTVRNAGAAFHYLKKIKLFIFILFLGIIRTALPNMDREAKEEYHVVIQAKDMGGHMGGLSGTTKVTITLTDVNDNPPKFPQSKWQTLYEITAVTNHNIKQLHSLEKC